MKYTKCKIVKTSILPEQNEWLPWFSWAFYASDGQCYKAFCLDEIYNIKFKQQD